MNKIIFKNGMQPALNDKTLNAMQDNIENAISELEKKFKWKSIDLNLSNNQSYTLAEINNVSEILVKFEYTEDKQNYVTVYVANDGVNGYYGIAGYYWNEATKNYPATFNINWQTGKIICNSDKANIKKIFYR